MEKNEAVKIEKVGNGYIVSPMPAQNEVRPKDDVRVFQSLGKAAQLPTGANGADSLFEFIERHFSE